MSERPSFSYSINAYYQEPVAMLVTNRCHFVDGRPVYLTSIGTTHDDTDPSSPKYEVLGMLLERWTALTEGLPRCILYEGRSTAYGPSRDSSIREFCGESGYLKWYANAHSIDAYSTEPSYDKEFELIRQRFPHGDGIVDNAEDIVRTIVGLRMLPFIHVRASGSMTPEDAFQEYLDSDGAKTAPGITLDNFSDIFEEYFGTPLDLDAFKNPNYPLIEQCRAITEPDRYRELLNDHPKLARLAEAASLTQETRTLSVGRMIVRKYMQGISVFECGGEPHKARLQKALAHLYMLYDPRVGLLPGYVHGNISHAARLEYGPGDIRLASLL